MKKIYRITESELHDIVIEAVNRIIIDEGIFDRFKNKKKSEKDDVDKFYKTADALGLKHNKNADDEDVKKFYRTADKLGLKHNISEEGEIGGGGATNCVGINVGGAAGQAKNHIDAPAFASKNKKKVGGNAFSEPIMRQKHNLGDVTNAPTNQVDMKPALKRGGSIAMGESFDRKINKAVDEGIGNWLKGAALGGMLAMSPIQGNAQQQQNYQSQQNDTVQVGNSRLSSTQQKDFSDRVRNAMRAAGDSEETINAESNIMTNFNTAYRNSRDESNSQIKKYLYYMNPSESTKKIFVSKGSGNKELRDFFGNMDVNAAMKYKAFVLPDEVYVVMPVSYTLQDVQNELGTLQLGDFDL